MLNNEALSITSWCGFAVCRASRLDGPGEGAGCLPWLWAEKAQSQLFAGFVNLRENWL